VHSSCIPKSPTGPVHEFPAIEVSFSGHFQPAFRGCVHPHRPYFCCSLQEVVTSPTCFFTRSNLGSFSLFANTAGIFSAES